MFIRSLFLGALAGAVLGIGAASAQQKETLLESQESLYNNIYVYQRSPYVIMTFGHNKQLYTESVFDTGDDRVLPVPYTQFMTAALMYAGKVNSILEIGSGGGRIAWYLHRSLPNARVTSIELDPAVLALSRKYFGIRDEQNFDLEARDGRVFLSQSKDKYDIILIDAYRGPFVPFHLMTREFYQIVKDHLADGGVVAQNVDPNTMLFDSAVKTIGAVLPQIEFYKTSDGSDDNIVTVAYDGAERKADDLATVASERDKAYDLRYSLASMLAERKRVDINNTQAIDANAKVLTDDFAPVDALKSIEQHNRKMP
ncbi:fused MFS/spermidine synthase [Bradyrhizobium jicamae]|uniref:Fused MFS/spermidine synthase n=1 Tax=Bradyrhizobium jicamae TaxID=280332 RepID=A0ABS5FQZ9_9BRAD|nr:fused MFS/spermidine synthase [Bradyrhizobium jicamae]MBR0799236.1 fused MFS/spermidine synthase [Bradyrhizobium jicamae]